MGEPIKIAVVLAGCGNKDGGEIHETVLTLLAIHKNGAEYQCFAPDIPMHHVLNFINDEEMPEKRNVLIEAARIARGDIRDLAQFNADNFDAIIFPGGLGVIKNLSSFAWDGADCTVIPEVEKAVQNMVAQNKPIGALCIAPVIMAKILGDVEVTLGPESPPVEAVEKMGATHRESGHGEIVVDRKKKLVTTPCYMMESRVDQIAEGTENLVKAIIELVE